MWDAESDGLLIGLVGSARNRVEFWRSFLTAGGAETVAEIGVWKGEFAADMLRSCPSIDTYYMVDPWAHLHDWNKPFNISSEEFNEVYSEAMGHTAFAADRRQVLRGKTLDVIDKISNQSLDFAYIDGDHTLKGIVTDLIAILPKMKPGAVIGGDDLFRSPWVHGPYYEPTLVFPFAVHFALAIRATIYALPFVQFLIALPSAQQQRSSSNFVDLTGKYRSLELQDLLAPPVRMAVTMWLRKLFLAPPVRMAVTMWLRKLLHRRTARVGG
jgi:hypothetical protein